MAIPPGKGLRCFPEEPATTGYVKSFMHTPHIDALHPFWDPQEEIGKSQLREAMERLNLSIEEIQRRYEALAHRFQLKLAWQANTPATPNP